MLKGEVRITIGGFTQMMGIVMLIVIVFRFPF